MTVTDAKLECFSPQPNHNLFMQNMQEYQFLLIWDTSSSAPLGVLSALSMFNTAEEATGTQLMTIRFTSNALANTATSPLASFGGI